MELDGVDLQPEVLQQARDDLDGRLALRAVEGVLSLVEVADHLDHERPLGSRPVESRGAGGGPVPVAPHPDAALGVDRQVLRDVRPVVRVNVIAVHRLDRRSLHQRMIDQEKKRAGCLWWQGSYTGL